MVKSRMASFCCTPVVLLCLMAPRDSKSFQAHSFWLRSAAFTPQNTKSVVVMYSEANKGKYSLVEGDDFDDIVEELEATGGDPFFLEGHSMKPTDVDDDDDNDDDDVPDLEDVLKVGGDPFFVPGYEVSSEEEDADDTGIGSWPVNRPDPPKLKDFEYLEDSFFRGDSSLSDGSDLNKKDSEETKDDANASRLNAFSVLSSMDPAQTMLDKGGSSWEEKFKGAPSLLDELEAMGGDPSFLDPPEDGGDGIEGDDWEWDGTIDEEAHMGFE